MKLKGRCPIGKLRSCCEQVRKDVTQEEGRTWDERGEEEL